MLGSDSTFPENNQEELQEEYLKSLNGVEEGGVIKGHVIQTDDEFVYLDVGLKSDGKVPVGEFDKLPSTGDIVEVVLIKQEGRNGEVVISKKKAEQKSIWNNLKDAFDQNRPINGRVDKSVKGGFEINIGLDSRAFCPISKMDIQRIENPEEYIGKELEFLVDRLYREKKVNIVLTRRMLLEKQKEEKREEFFQTVKIGDEVEGEVKSFTSFGAFIDLGGFDGLLHINDMSWGHVSRIKDHVCKGQILKLKVIKMDPENKKINLSQKHTQPDPWESFEDKYQLNQVVKGTVTKLTDFGAFIEIEEGIEGLAHVSELSWIKRIKHPKEIFSIGDVCETMILGYDVPNGRISLGVKQVLPDPWENIKEKYPVGTKGNWLVKKITNAGAFIELEEDIDAFLHVSDLSWTKKTRDVSSVLTENERIEAVIISFDIEERRIRVGVKQMTENPWETFGKNHPRNSVVKGEIVGKTDFGLFVKVEGDIEGLIHKNNLVNNREENADEKLTSFNVGDIVEAAVTEVDSEKKKLFLSIRGMEYHKERAQISQYIEADDDSPNSYTLADALKDKL